MSKPVYLQKVTPGDAEETQRAVKHLLASLPAGALPTKESRVLIKPNLLAKHAPEKAITTHPDVLRALILALQERGIQDILVADSPGGTYTPGGMKAIYATCGITAVCEETGTACYTDCQSTRTHCEGQLVREFELLQPVLERDYIINLPKLKTHVLTGISGAVKNLFGCVPGLSKAEFHMRFPQKELFGQMLVDLCECVKPRLHLVDGIFAMEGDGPAGGQRIDTGLLLAGQDPYAVDLAICRLVGMPPERVPTLVAAQGAGLCSFAEEELLLCGTAEATTPIENFQLPRSYEGRLDFSNKLPAFLRWAAPFANQFLSPRPVVHTSSCIGCGKCAEICPKNVITIQGKKARIEPKDCIRCFCCHEMCPVKAIDVKKLPLFRL